LKIKAIALQYQFLPNAAKKPAARLKITWPEKSIVLPNHDSLIR